MAIQGQDRAFGQPGVDAKRQRGTHQHLVETRRQHLREALPAELQRSGHARPALLDKLFISLAKTIRRGHLAILQPTALLVAVAVERCYYFGGKPRGLFENSVDGVAVQTVVQLLAMPAHVKQFVQHKTHIAQRRLITHALLSTSSKSLPTPIFQVEKQGLPTP